MKKSILFFAGLLIISCAGIAQPEILFHEEFDGGIPSSWQISTAQPDGAVWQWSPDGKADSAWYNSEPIAALFWGNRPAIASPSAENGTAMFNSDAYDSAGLGIGDGPFPENQRCDLISPSISCADAPRVYLKFNQYARAFLNDPSTLVSISSDGGQSWTYFPINTSISENRSTLPTDVEIIDISSVAGNQPSVNIRFSWQGRYHFWLIDDVELITPPASELLMPLTLYPPSSFSQPALQVVSDTFRFGASISNLGYLPSDSIIFSIDLLEQIGTQEDLIFKDSIFFSLPAFCEDSLITIPDIYLPDLPTGEYRIIYRIRQLPEADYNTTNNQSAITFRITIDQYAKENDIDLGIRPLDGGDYEVGNVYNFGTEATYPAEVRQVVFSAAKDSTDGSLAGSSVDLSLYQIDESVETDFSNFELNDYQQLQLIGMNNFTFPPESENFDLFTTSLLPVEGTSIFLEPGWRYLLTASYTGNNNTVFHSFNDDIVYNNISTIVYQNQWFLGGFGNQEAAVLRLLIDNSFTSVSVQAENAQLEIFPNPAQEEINIKLPTLSTLTNLVITNEMGQLVSMQELPISTSDHLSRVSIDHLPSGVYNIQLISKAGRKRGRFIKI